MTARLATRRGDADCDAGSMGYYRSGSGNLRPIPVTARRAEEPKEGGKKGQGSRRTVPITYCLMVIAIYVACGGAVFSQWERWSLLDACYFSYISLSTIGFGDLVIMKYLSVWWCLQRIPIN
ncbi:Potassium channel subfamily K member 3 [Portunus trituberculatus]|uniref:Potassium channel subfamily K member 3 n=1 Tax=Portunus trituberculatus TaxID=210409 RepID=A0A5B7J3F4_PORTR|nr:Potassium channel subfamily K member 3 [Portunus trituberculatus]